MRRLKLLQGSGKTQLLINGQVASKNAINGIKRTTARSATNTESGRNAIDIANAVCSIF
jgi:hypothetical protein